MGNVPPKSGIRVPAGDMRLLVQTLFERVGMSAEHAATMAGLLVATDLRGVVSHGTWQTAGYCRMILDGKVNPAPDIKVVRESTTAQTLDGDGGMGHLPCRQGAEWAVGRALEHGAAAVTTRNHFHFGGAGKYSRMVAARDCIGISVSSHRFNPRPGNILGIKGSSPISIALPAGEQPPVVLDMGSSFLPYDDDLFERMPFAFFKEMGISASAYALGGVLAGIYKPEFIPPASRWESNQGSFIAAFSVESFMDLDEYRAEMDRWIAQASALDPLPGCDRAELPGGLEWRREREYAREGIPVGDETRGRLEEIAAELGVETPFSRYLHTRFGEGT